MKLSQSDIQKIISEEVVRVHSSRGRKTRLLEYVDPVQLIKQSADNLVKGFKQKMMAEFVPVDPDDPFTGEFDKETWRLNVEDAVKSLQDQIKTAIEEAEDSVRGAEK